MTREAWMTRMCDLHIFPLLKEHAKAEHLEVRPYRVSVGFPGGGSARTRIGECWAADTSGHGVMFISPVLGDVNIIVSTLVHECIHHMVGCDKGHKGEFKRLALAVGLEGKMTSTTMGATLAARVTGWLADMPELPHAALVKPERGKKGSRLLKCECPSCGYTVRTTAKWLDAAGAPLCPVESCYDENDMPIRMSVAGKDEESAGE